MSRYNRLGQTYFYDDGEVLANGYLYFYETGTNTPLATYSDEAQTIPNTVPVELDAAGRSGSVFFNGTAKLVINDTYGVQIDVEDPVFGNDITAPNSSDWIATSTYSANDIVKGSDGLYYQAVYGSNLNQDPTIVPTAWAEIQFLNVWNQYYTYKIGDVAIATDNSLYVSLTNSNINNTPIGDPANWEALNDQLLFVGVAEMALSSPQANAVLRTSSHALIGDGGQASYLVKTAAQATTDGDIIDTFGNHALANGNVAILITGARVNARQYGLSELLSGAANAARMNALLAAESVIYMPSGTYEFDAVLVRVNGLDLIGDGKGSTILKFTASTDGLVVTNATSADKVRVSGMTFQTATVATQTAIVIDNEAQVSGSSVVDGNDYRGEINNVGFMSATDPTTDGWLIGVHAKVVIDFTISKCDYIGYYLTNKYDSTGTAFLFNDGAVAGDITLRNNNVANCTVYNAAFAVKMAQSSRCTITENTFRLCDVAVDITNVTLQSNNIIADNVINFFTYAFNGTYCSYPKFSNNSTTNQASAAATSDHVLLADSVGALISGNVFTVAGATSSRGVNITSLTTDTLIDSNMCSGLAVGWLVAAATVDNKIGVNGYVNVTAVLTDAGTNTQSLVLPW